MKKKSFSTPLQDKIIENNAQCFKTKTIEEHPDTLLDLDFSVSEIEEAFSELNASSAVGPDGMSALLLKRCKKRDGSSLTYDMEITHLRAMPRYDEVWADHPHSQGWQQGRRK